MYDERFPAVRALSDDALFGVIRVARHESRDRFPEDPSRAFGDDGGLDR